MGDTEDMDSVRLEWPSCTRRQRPMCPPAKPHLLWPMMAPRRVPPKRTPIRSFGPSDDGSRVVWQPTGLELLEAMGWQTGQFIPGELLRPAQRVLEGGRTGEFDLLCPAGRTFAFAVAWQPGGPDESLCE